MHVFRNSFDFFSYSYLNTYLVYPFYYSYKLYFKNKLDVVISYYNSV